MRQVCQKSLSEWGALEVRFEEVEQRLAGRPQQAGKRGPRVLGDLLVAAAGWIRLADVWVLAGRNVGARLGPRATSTSWPAWGALLRPLAGLPAGLRRAHR